MSVVGVIALLLAVPPGETPHPRAEPGPLAVVRAFYERDSIRAHEYYSARLKHLFTKDETPGEVGNVDFAFHVNAQDVEAGWEKTLQFELIDLGTDRAVVRVTFRNFRPQDLHFTLVREQGRWLIDDARSVAAGSWVLSEILEGPR